MLPTVFGALHLIVNHLESMSEVQTIHHHPKQRIAPGFRIRKKGQVEMSPFYQFYKYFK